MGLLKKNYLSKITGLVILSIVLFAQFSQKKWNEKDEVITADVRGYYAYLPALFIYDDIKLERLDEIPYAIWHMESEDGTRSIKYTCGMSIMYSPFFFVAHMLAEFTGAQADGFSYPYKFALVMSSLFYLIIALIFLSKFLLLHFKDSTVAITLLVLFLGTNALHYYTAGMTFSHGYSLALLSVFLYGSTKWLSKPSLKWAFWIGVTAGLMVLIRPIDIVFLLFLPLFKVSSLKERFQLFWQNKSHVIFMIAFFILMLLPQFIYNKYISDSFFYYSYTGESFFFLDPHLWDSLFSYRNGWLVYSPLMVFSIVGFFFLKQMKAKSGLFILSVFCIYFYVIASWWCWWYVGFGNRAYINLYPILSVPLACFIQFMLSQSRFKKVVFKLILFAGIFLSVFQTYQFEKQAIHWGAMTKDAYWDSFGRSEPSQLFYSFLRYPDVDNALLGIDAVHAPVIDTIYFKKKTFDARLPGDSIFAPFYQTKKTHRGTGALFIPKNIEYSLGHPVSVSDANRIYITAWVQNSDDVHFGLGGTDSIPYFAGRNEVYRRDKDWDQIHLYATIPDSFELDTLNFFIWNHGGKDLWLDDLEVTATFVKTAVKEIE